MSMQITKVWWDGDKLMAEPISASEVYKPEPLTEWLTCPKCAHKSPYTPVKAKTLAEEAEQITKRARAAIETMRTTDESVAWRNAAIRVGEDLCSVGPFGYYDMSAKQWLDWALSVVTVHAPPQPAAWVGLTDEEVEALASWWPSYDQMPALKVLIKDVTNSLKEKNT